MGSMRWRLMPGQPRPGSDTDEVEVAPPNRDRIPGGLAYGRRRDRRSVGSPRECGVLAIISNEELHRKRRAGSR